METQPPSMDDRADALSAVGRIDVADADKLSLIDYAEAVAKANEKKISVIVPAANDKVHLHGCFIRVDSVLRNSGYAYEIIVVDDHSRDGTEELVNALKDAYPVRLIEKRGKKGRTFSIKEGLDASEGGIVVLLDPDVNFPPEGFTFMLNTLRDASVVISTRRTYPSLWYFIVSKVYRWIFGRVLLNVNADIRAGIKMFRRSVLESLRFDPEFDLRFGFDAMLLYHAQRMGWLVDSVSMSYFRPMFRHGVWEAIRSRVILGTGIVVIRVTHTWRTILSFLYPPAPVDYFTAGFTNVNDYLFLTPSQSAKGHITKETVSLSVAMVLLGYVIWRAVSTIAGVSMLWLAATMISILYLVIMCFKLWMMIISMRSVAQQCTAEELSLITDEELPVISIMIPLYKEQEIIPQIFQYLSDFDYPTDKLDIIFILESTDTETAAAFTAMNPPSHFKALLTPDIPPKTKPKAMNVALSVAKGDILVIFDAEVLPERDQLKKAYLTFKRHPDAMYLHSKMDVYNANENWITRLYTAEFAYFYHFFLPGLVASRYPMPISGHSTYFRRQVIEKVGAWDAYNVAEDCDIGIRIFRKGFGSGMILESHTWEQSTTSIPTWVRQRTRWTQGFIQTSIVQLRYPLLLKRELGSWANFAVFLLLVPGTVILNILNMFQWCMFILWYTTEAPFLQIAYGGFSIYLATICLFFGNFLFTFFTMYSLYERRHYAIVPWALLSFVYWIMLGIATIRATIHLFLHPHKWDKTTHSVAKRHS
jgi:cellulose synthase/poly-beta-1,6-N-acetylglucosamine synthase-like glycosyltransferase